MLHETKSFMKFNMLYFGVMVQQKLPFMNFMSLISDSYKFIVHRSMILRVISYSASFHFPLFFILVFFATRLQNLVVQIFTRKFVSLVIKSICGPENYGANCLIIMKIRNALQFYRNIFRIHLKLLYLP